MTIGLVMKFAGLDTEKYDDIMQTLDLPLHDDDNPNWPDGIISHAAGATPTGWCVVDVWESQAAFDKFFADRLKPAMYQVGMTAPPEITPVEIYNTYRHGRS